MSGQTLTGNALQFTDDNKHAYVFSGQIGLTNTINDLLSFTTNSEYLNSKIQVTNGSGAGDDFIYEIKFNGVVVCNWYYNSVDTPPEQPFSLIIPPFTLVEITGDNLGGATARNHTAWLTAKVGMAPRVGN